jgi:ATP adenylyltransferase
MDYLWTPWRYSYVTAAPPGTDPKGPGAEACLFCRLARAPEEDSQNLVVLRGERNFVLLNRFPYNNGHAMIAPYEHVATLEESDTSTLEEAMRLAQRVEKTLRALYRPDGLNLGYNIGQSAGAGIAGHIHLHILPRWFGDTSFMTTVGETRVLPEDLETTGRRLTEALAAGL